MAVDTSRADVWIDPRPRAVAAGVSGSDGSLLQGALYKEGTWPPVGPLEAEWPPEERAASKQVSEEQRAAMARLQLEMGFSEVQVAEAFKRCSTTEGAIDWILSAEREWNS